MAVRREFRLDTPPKERAIKQISRSEAIANHGRWHEFSIADCHAAPCWVATVNLGDALRHIPAKLASHRSDYGMVSVDYSWSWAGAILASVQNLDEMAMLSFHSAVQADKARLDAADRQIASQRVDTTWWRPYASTELYLFLGNSTGLPKTVTVNMRSESGASLADIPVTLAPHASVKLDIFALPKKSLDVRSVGSLSLDYSGPPHSLVAFANLQDQTNGFSANLHLVEAHPENARVKDIHQVAVAIPGVLLGHQRAKMQFPENTFFAPYLLLHNTAQDARAISLSASYSSSGARSTVPLGTTSLPPGVSRQVDLSSLISKSSITPDQGVIDIEESFSGNDGDIASEAGSTDQTGNYVFEADPQLETWTSSRTICYWTISGDTNTMISLWNYSGDTQDLVLTLHFEAGSYNVPIHLEASADLDLDLATLFKSRVPDENGTLLPNNIYEGSATLASTKGESAKLSVASSASTFNVRNGTCTNQCGTCNGPVSEAFIPLSLGIGASAQATGTMTYNTGSIYYVTTNASSWSASGSTVASIQSSGMATGVSAGSSQATWVIDGAYYGAGYICTGNSFYCPSGTVGATGPVIVQKPTYFFSPSYTSTTGPSGACQNKTGKFIDVSYYVADQSGVRVNRAGLEPDENENGTWNMNFTTPSTTRSDGSFDDTPFGACYGFTGHYCGLPTSRAFQITELPGYFVDPIGTNTTQKFCTDGVTLTIQGNPTSPTNQNKTYTVGNVQ